MKWVFIFYSEYSCAITLIFKGIWSFLIFVILSFCYLIINLLNGRHQRMLHLLLKWWFHVWTHFSQSNIALFSFGLLILNNFFSFKKVFIRGETITWSGLLSSIVKSISININNVWLFTHYTVCFYSFTFIKLLAFNQLFILFTVLLQ